MQNSLTASIVGASGYSGAELLRILHGHPHIRIHKLFANTSSGKKVDEIYPRFGKTMDRVFERYSAKAACSSDVVFLALPSGEAMHIVPELLDQGKRIVDLGGDFRLPDAMLYEQYYKHKHTAPSLLGRSVYGLPEWNREDISKASLVANPGCYPTGAILPLVPLLKEGAIDMDGLVISSLSGVSGAGRGNSQDLSFVEVNESVKAYKVGVHQHIPEIQTILTALTGKRGGLTFVPHLIPITRGIYTTIVAPLNKSVSQEHVMGIYNKYYGEEPFIRVSSSSIPEIKNVNFTNFIDIGFRIHPDNGRIIVLSTIDNLVKGAAGQAVQNMNIMFGFRET